MVWDVVWQLLLHFIGPEIVESPSSSCAACPFSFSLVYATCQPNVLIDSSQVKVKQELFRSLHYDISTVLLATETAIVGLKGCRVNGTVMLENR